MSERCVRQRLLRRLVVSAIGCALLACPTRAQADPKPRPIKVSSAELNSVTFAKLVLRLKGSNDVSFAGDDVRLKFLELMRSKGYPALGAESLVFDQDNSSRARFMLGGTINELECARADSSGRRCRVGIQWELLDRASDRVSYRVVTRHLHTGRTPAELGMELVTGAFYSLLARQKFVDALKKRDDDHPSKPEYPKVKFRRCPAASLTMPSSADTVLKATVMVESGQSLGSGVSVSPDGLVLTAAHVLTAGAATTVQTQGGTRSPAIVVRVDHHEDVALLKVDASTQTPCLVARAEPMRSGEEVYAIGSPLGRTLSFTLTHGIVSGIREIDGVSLLQTDASINRGNSGGPLIDKTGRWSAITSWKVVGGGVEGIAFGVPTKAALDGLSLEPGDATDSALTRAEVPRAAEAATLADDDADPIVGLFDVPKPKAESKPTPSRTTRVDEPSAALLPAEPEKPSLPMTPTAKTLATVGWISTGVGALGVVGSWQYYKAKSGEWTTNDFGHARTVNDASWVVLLAGGATTLVAYLLPRQQPAATPSPKVSTSAVTWDAGVGPGSVSVLLRY